MNTKLLKTKPATYAECVTWLREIDPCAIPEDVLVQPTNRYLLTSVSSNGESDCAVLQFELGPNRSNYGADEALTRAVNRHLAGNYSFVEMAEVCFSSYILDAFRDGEIREAVITGGAIRYQKTLISKKKGQPNSVEWPHLSDEELVIHVIRNIPATKEDEAELAQNRVILQKLLTASHTKHLIELRIKQQCVDELGSAMEVLGG